MNKVNCVVKEEETSADEMETQLGDVAEDAVGNCDRGNLRDCEFGESWKTVIIEGQRGKLGEIE